MRSVNMVILIGNLTRDPELKTTASGQSIVSFGIATNRQWTTSTGEKRSSAEFHECVAWAKLAEICKNNLKKGMLVHVLGYLKTRSWDMEDGTRRFRTEVVLQDMIILEKRPGNADDYVPGEEDGMMMGGGEMEDMSMSSAPAPSFAAAPSAPMPAMSAPAPTPATESTPTPSANPTKSNVSIDDDNMF
jgi:single-strand DNA-binding protein